MVDVTVIIPARNEEDVIRRTIWDTYDAVVQAGFTIRFVVVNDHSTDTTIMRAVSAVAGYGTVGNNVLDPGYGNAVRTGMTLVEPGSTHSVVVMVADGSDAPADLVNMLEHFQKRPDAAVFGTRFAEGGSTTGYPALKRKANRLGNVLTAIWLNRRNYTDYTNPFKLYPERAFRHAIHCSTATDFSLGYEVCLRYLLVNEPFQVVPHQWVEREVGTSKFKVKHVIGFARTWFRVWRTNEWR